MTLSSACLYVPRAPTGSAAPSSSSRDWLSRPESRSKKACAPLASGLALMSPASRAVGLTLAECGLWRLTLGAECVLNGVLSPGGASAGLPTCVSQHSQRLAWAGQLPTRLATQPPSHTRTHAVTHTHSLTDSLSLSQPWSIEVKGPLPAAIHRGDPERRGGRQHLVSMKWTRSQIRLCFYNSLKVG